MLKPSGSHVSPLLVDREPFGKPALRSASWMTGMPASVVSGMSIDTSPAFAAKASGQVLVKRAR